MSEIPTQQRTPARRRNGRQSTRSVAQKAYASENDVANVEPSGRRYPPQTPDKMGNSFPTNTSLHPDYTSSMKSKSGSQAQSRTALTSPAESLPTGGRTPPQSGSMKPGTSAAFAGATFHASPAPSALPIPSFLPKSSGESPISGDTSSLQPSPPVDRHAPTPFRPSSFPKANGSPLDFMFRAHREERERRSQQSISAPYNAEQASPQNLPQGSAAELPKSSSSPHTGRSFLKQQFNGFDASELDGTPGQPVGPAFATPYHERIKAARSSSESKTSKGRTVDDQSVDISQERDSTDALKRFLFGTGSPANANPASAPSDAGSIPSQGKTPENSLSKDGKVHAFEHQAGSVEALENDLRRLLKLDVSSKSAVANHESLSR